MARRIDSNEDMIDSRDVIARIEELQGERDALEEDGKELDESDAEELAGLKRLAAQGEDIQDWRYGATLIRDSYFPTYAEEYAKNVHGDAVTAASWPFSHIDWDEATYSLKQDYEEIDWDGVTYFVR